MEQLVSAPPPPHASVGALLRACRHRALLAQEQLAARAGLSERTVRDLEGGRVRSPRLDTVRLLTDALQLSGPQRESWFEAARGVNRQRAGRTATGPGGLGRRPGGTPAQSPLRASGSGMGSKRRCHRSPAAELMAEIVAPCQREDWSADQGAQDAGPAETAVRAQAGRPGPDAGARGDRGLTCADRLELAELRRENRRLREDIETLKRATAIFAAAAR